MLLKRLQYIIKLKVVALKKGEHLVHLTKKLSQTLNTYIDTAEENSSKTIYLSKKRSPLICKRTVSLLKADQ